MLGTGMLVGGAWGTWMIAQRALSASAAPVAARIAQGVCLLAVVVFLWPSVKGLFAFTDR